MLLGVDAGNSNVKFAVFDGAQIVARFNFAHDAHAIDCQRVQSALALLGSPRISAVALASVGPHAEALTAALTPLAPNSTLCLHSGLDLGVFSAYADPQSLGIDRLLNTIAAYELYQAAAIVADLGTATNFECVGPNGEFLGGAICAGPQLSLDALSARSTKLLPVSFQPPSDLIATNTRDALLSGAFFGHAEMVRGMLERFKAGLPNPCTTILTGGFATVLFPLVATADHLNPDLTLQGLRIAVERLQRRKQI